MTVGRRGPSEDDLIEHRQWRPVVTKLTWYGISAVTITSPEEETLLIDPCFTDNPDAPVSHQAIPKVDVIAVTHGARDHFGDAIAIAKRTGAMLLAPADVAMCAIKNGIPESQTRRMVPGGTRKIGSFTIRAVKAEHISFTRCGDTVFSGVPLGYVVRLTDGNRIYHAGDTCLFSDMKLIGDLEHPNIALLPIGMFRGAVTELEPEEAAIAADWVGANTVFPVHYDLSTQPDNPERLRRALAERGVEIDLRIANPGAEITFNERSQD